MLAESEINVNEESELYDALCFVLYDAADKELSVSPPYLVTLTEYTCFVTPSGAVILTCTVFVSAPDPVANTTFPGLDAEYVEPPSVLYSIVAEAPAVGVIVNV